MKRILLLMVIGISMAINAQVIKVSLRASGLTCSMCSNSIYKALKTLDFVEAVDANVKTYTFEISFKRNSGVDFGRIKKKVEDSGFSVSEFIATIYFTGVQLRENQPVTVGNNILLFVNREAQSLDGARQVRFLDKGFVSSEEYKRAGVPGLSAGSYHVTTN